MFFDTSRKLGMESVAAILGLPELTSNYDDPREASYYAIVTGTGGWQYAVWVRESFYPLNKGPAAFVPGLHPKRLRRLADSSRRLNIDFSIPAVAGRSEKDCEAIYSYTKAAKSAGWKDEIPAAIPLDGGRAIPSFIGPNGRGFSVVPPFGNSCLAELTFAEEPKPKR